MPVAKKTTAKKTTTKKSASASDPIKGLVDDIVTAINAGELDGYLTPLDDAITNRVNEQQKKSQAAAKKTTGAAKKVSAPPKKSSEASASVEKPVKGTDYKVRDAFKPLAGATVEFVRVKPDTNGQKIAVVMKTDKPGSPKGKRVVIPANAIEPMPAAKKRAPVRKGKK